MPVPDDTRNEFEIALEEELAEVRASRAEAELDDEVDQVAFVEAFERKEMVNGLEHLRGAAEAVADARRAGPLA
jgi:hypothetical protein